MELDLARAPSDGGGRFVRNLLKRPLRLDGIGGFFPHLSVYNYLTSRILIFSECRIKMPLPFRSRCPASRRAARGFPLVK